MQQIELDCIKQGLSEKTMQKYACMSRLIKNITGKEIGSLIKHDVENIFLYFYKDQTQAADTKIHKWKTFKRLIRMYNEKLIGCVLKYRLPFREKVVTHDLILSMGQINDMIAFSPTLRIRTMMGVLYESGMRSGEIRNLKIKDIIFDEYGAILSVDGKTGPRQIRIVKSVFIFKEYLTYHRFRANPESYVFCKAGRLKCTCMTSQGFAKIIKEIGRLAGVQKRIYPHLIRHTRATHLAQFMTESEMRIYFGWSLDSDMPSKYVHLANKNVDDKILHINGVKPMEPPQMII